MEEIEGEWLDIEYIPYLIEPFVYLTFTKLMLCFKHKPTNPNPAK